MSLMTLPINSSECTAGTDKNVAFFGKIVRSDINPKFFVIESHNATYDPMNLDQIYQVEKLEVRVNATIQDELSGFTLFGTVIKINQISLTSHSEQ